MLEVIRYTSDKKEEWDEFVSQSKNGLFLFKRDFMEYHSDRFNDYSLMLYDNSKLVSLFPANCKDDKIYSHQGLTFGGLISLYKTTSLQIISHLNSINHYLNINSFKEIFYKSIPQIYKSHIGEEDDYIMFRFNGELESVFLSSVLDLHQPSIISRNRKRSYQKALDSNVIIEPSSEYGLFWEVMMKNLHNKYQKSPVHTVEEMVLLNSRFKENIKLYVAKMNDEIIGGALLFLFKNVVKVQYAHASSFGKNVGAIDSLYFYIIDKYKNKFKYIDFGHSNEGNGSFINTGLNAQKESFGARGMTIKTYKYLTQECINA